MSSQTFSILFLVFFGVTYGLRFYLAWRQIHSVQQHRAKVPAAFAADVPLPDHQKAADYTQAKVKLAQKELALDAAVLLAFTLGGGLQWLAQLAQSTGASPLWQGVWMMLGFMGISLLIGLPIDYYRTFVLEQKFGFNKMTRRLFVGDALKNMLLGLAIGVPILFVVLWLMQKMGGAWWLYTWVALAGFQLLMLMIFPKWIAPLFNKFTPLEDITLKEKIDALLHKCGFASNGVFVMDGSKRSGHGNAYFTGFGKTKRIVFFDTLLKDLSPAQIEAVLAHELGHFKHKHVIKRMVVALLMLLGGLALLGFLREQAWFYQGLGFAVDAAKVGDVNPAVSLLLFMLVLPVFMFVLNPLSSYASRKHEFEADEYAAQVSEAKDLIAALSKLYKENASTLTPDAWYSLFYDSHPPAPIRVQHLQSLKG